VQEALAWRAFAWHKRRFQRRVEEEFARRWNDFDAVYVHGDVVMASAVARYRPTMLRLPGPVGAQYGDMLRSIPLVCANGDALVRTRAFLGDHAMELPVGIDLEVFSPGTTSVRHTLGWSDRDRVVGYVGRLTHLKGVDLLAAAFRDLPHDSTGARLLMIGTGEEEGRVRAVLARQCAAGVVHIEPGLSHDQLPAWYRAMDLIVMPSRYENHSNALMEAMASGIPFLASNVGGNVRLSETGAGWLFQSESIPSLTEGLRTVLQNRSELKARGELGVRAVDKQHTWDVSAERLEDILCTYLAAMAGSERRPHTCGDFAPVTRSSQRAR